MKKISHYLLVSVLFLAISCGPTSKEENQKLRDEVIAVHDEVMPLMGKLKTLEKEALAEIADLESQEEVDSTRLEAMKALAYDLNQAYEGMFVWMRQYDIEDGEKTDEQIKSYLADQMTQVTVVNEDINAALTKAEELLKD